MKFCKVILLLLIMGWSMKSSSQGLLNDIKSITKNMKATVGIAVLKDRKTVALLNNRERYPLMSVFKFHVAVAALDKMSKRNVCLDDSLNITPDEIKKNTYSPLREKIHYDKPFHLSFRTLLYYSIALSDNNACDILIRYAGGISNIQRFWKRNRLKDFRLTETENSMHENLLNCYNNWSTPLSMAQCLKTVYEGNILKGEYKKFLFDTMLATSTGADKIKAGLPANTPLAHKTGSSDRLPTGVTIADNDAGIIFLPNGNKYYFVIFLKNVTGLSGETHRTVADISRIVYRYCSR